MSTESSLVEAYQSHYVRLVRIAAAITRDAHEAEDAVQEAFLKVHRRLVGAFGTEISPDRVVPYLTVAAVNEARSRVRRSARRGWLPLSSSNEDGVASCDSWLMLRVEQMATAEAVRGLPRRQQQCVVLSYWADLSTAEISAALGITESSVRSNIARALRGLGRKLGDEQSEAPTERRADV